MTIPAQKTINLLLRLWIGISQKRKRQFLLLSFLMVIVAFFEVASIGAVAPFLAVLINAKAVFNHSAIQPLIAWMAWSNPNQLLLPLTATFVIAAILAGLLRTLLLWALTKFSLSTCADLSSEIYLRTLYQDYEVHISRNSSQIINGVLSQTNSVIYDTILPLMFLISSVIMCSIILTGLIFLDVKVALSAILGFGLIYLLVILGTKNQLSKNGKTVARESTQMVKSVQEGLGGIRDVLLDGSQSVYWGIYQKANLPLRHVQASIAFIGGSPRFLVESCGMVVIALLTYSFSTHSNEGVVSVLPFLGALAVAAQRLLPMFQQIYLSMTSIRAGRQTLQDILDLLEQPLTLKTHMDNSGLRLLSFERDIILKNISFHYPSNSSWVLRNIDLKINRGERVGFIGKTGSGKSTLIDLVMGLLAPTEGSLVVDGQLIDAKNRHEWQRHIAHVPQTIFLSDASILENIAFGVPKHEIDIGRVYQAAAKAQIAGLIEQWPNGYDTAVGERGVRLSGGQRQRIGIARALYKEADVIIFDEATSALDLDTETSVMETIDSLSIDLTILVIAHRLSTLRNCTKIIELDHGEIKNSGDYEFMIPSHPLKL